MPRPKTDPVLAIQDLARSFAGLDGRPGVSPWEPKAMDVWAFELAAYQNWGTRAAAQFVLSVWDRDRLWRCGRFEAVHSMSIWDEADRAAFLAWATDPWWVEDGVRRKPKRERRRA